MYTLLKNTICKTNPLQCSSILSQRCTSWHNITSLSSSIRTVSATSNASATAQAAKKDTKTDPSTKPVSHSFAINAFCGKLVTDQLLPYPDVLSSEQMETLQQMVGPTMKFFEEKNNPVKNEELEKVEDETVKGLAEIGAYGLQVPEEYGGVGLTNTQYARMVEIVGAHDLGVGIALGAHQSIGLKGILLYGTPEQKKKYLPDLAAGKVMAAYCLTEPSSGSDAASIQTRADKSADGKHFVLNGGKIWISNGGTANVFTVFARTKTPGDAKEKLTAFIVERDFGGITHSAPEKKMGIKASNTAALFIEECKVPVENVLGGEGNGFKVAMNILNSGRFGMAAALSGTMRSCIAKAAQHAAQRKQFNATLSSYGGIQEKLARMSMRHYITESMAYMISGNMDKGVEDIQVEAAISKVYGSESAWYCCDEAIQILGGMGYMKDCGLEKVLRDLRIFRIFEGTNEILRLFSVLTSLNYAGKELSQLSQTMKNPLANPGALLGFATSRAKRAVGLSRGMDVDSSSFKAGCPSSVHPSVELLAQCVGELGAVSQDLLMQHKKGIVNRQFELNRLADAVIDIFSMAVGLARVSRSHKLNLSTTDLETRMVTLFCSDTHRRVVHSLRGINEKSEAQNRELMQSISQEVCSHGGVVQTNPLGF